MTPIFLICFRTWRLAAYSQFTWWVHGFLGRKNPRVIPACVVKPIRMEFTEESEIAEIDLVEGLKSTIIIVDNIVLQFFLLDKMFLLIDSS